jgi:hypothetical protein
MHPFPSPRSGRQHKAPGAAKQARGINRKYSQPPKWGDSKFNLSVTARPLSPAPLSSFNRGPQKKPPGLLNPDGTIITLH